MNTVETKIGRLRRRLLGVHLAAATVWGFAAALLLVLLGAWLDLLWELPPAWRTATLWAAVAVGLVLLAMLAVLTWRAAQGFALARRLDEAGRARGRILTGWEFEQSRYGIAGELPTPLSAGLATLAANDAAWAAADVSLSLAAPWRPLRRALAAVVLLAAVVGALTIVLPGMVGVQWNRFARPNADTPPFSRTEFEVTPGNKLDVIYGSDLEICAAVHGAAVDQVELVLTSAGGQEPPLPMFPEADGRWRTVLTKVVEPTEYFVRAYRARSHVYRLGVITVPRIETARLRIAQPGYARRPPYEGLLPKDGVSGLRGSQVEIFLTSNRPLDGGRIVLSMAGADAKQAHAPMPPATSIPMKPAEPGSREVSGKFTIAGDGRFECRVVDEAGQVSQQTFSGNVILLPDERPLVRLLEPPRISLATPSAGLPVLLSAEDDCGVSRLQLFRSLNDSRSLPADLPVPSSAPRRFDAPTVLPLGRYGLAPGDVIKLFGRVEDNDPAGVKGSESTVAIVRIISEEEFQRLLKTQETLEMLLSKYDDARRRMERLGDQVEKLRKKAKKQPADKKAEQELRNELAKLRQAMRQEAEAMRQAAKRLLPFDIDRALTPELERLAKTNEAMAAELERLERERGLISSKLGKKLDEMARQLDSSRKLYDQMAGEPLRYLEAAFPLMADQDRFVMLVLWQRDLADRLAALKGHDKRDDPALKARMRDLEEEQRQVRDALARLLDDIQEHVDRLPDKSEFKALRETAEDFVKRVRKSGASEAMAEAEAALAEFAGTRGHQKAKDAADILARFLNECNNCKNGACKGMTLAFRPQLCDSLSNTLNQLLNGFGTGQGNGAGNGPGGMGFGSQGRVGLFGGPPELGGEERSQQSGGNQQSGRRAYAAAPGENPDDADSGAARVPDAVGGASEGAVPARYRRQVGQYFERVAEETRGAPSDSRRRSHD
ncbi:MAG: hypothetical protein ABFC63_09555 [Thermoguttaceae bacterium]